MSAKYPSFNDREFDLLKKLTNNTAELADGSGVPLTIAEANALYFRLDGANSPFTKTSATIVTVPDAFSLASAGSIALTAGGSNKNITISATGAVIFPGGVALPAIQSTFTFQIGSRNLVDGVATTPYFQFRRTNTSAANPTNTTNGQGLGTIYFKGYAATQYSAPVAEITANASEDWTDSANGTELNFGTTVNGQIGGNFRLKLGGYGKLTQILVNGSLPAWGVTGCVFSQGAATYTDTNSATGTVASAVFNSFAVPAINATNASVVYTNLANVYIAGDAASTGNASATNKWGLWNVGKTRNDGNQTQTGTTTLNFGLTALANIGVSADTTAGILQIKSPASGTITLTTANALGLTLSGGAAATLTGGAGNMTITAGTGNSRTLTLQTTTSGGTATNCAAFDATQNVIFGGSIKTSTPTTGTAGVWKLGVLVTTASVFDTTKYIQVDIGGTLYKIATCT